jgi:hypothetical protein
VKSSPSGALFGHLIHHPAALASTVTPPDRVPLPAARAPFQAVASFPRGSGEPPYTVVHDTTVHAPFGRYCVYVGARRLGAQLSVPSLADCHRMEAPDPFVAPIEQRVDMRGRQALALGNKAFVFSSPNRIKGLDEERLKARYGHVRELEGGAKVKRCTGCKTDRPLEQFSRGTGPGGLHRYCRNCVRAYHAARKRGDE